MLIKARLASSGFVRFSKVWAFSIHSWLWGSLLGRRGGFGGAGDGDVFRGRAPNEGLCGREFIFKFPEGFVVLGGSSFSKGSWGAC